MTRIIQLIDNLDYARDGTETPAAHTLRITWQVDEAKPERYELDLTRSHLAEYLESLGLLTEHANPGSAPPARRPDRTPAGHRSHGSPAWEGQGLAATLAWRGKQRDFVDRYGITALDGPERPPYETPAGGTFWPAWADRSYQWYLETGEVIVPVTRAEFEASGDDRSWKTYMLGWTPSREPRRVIAKEGD